MTSSSSDDDDDGAAGRNRQPRDRKGETAGTSSSDAAEPGHDDILRPISDRDCETDNEYSPGDVGKCWLVWNLQEQQKRDNNTANSKSEYFNAPESLPRKGKSEIDCKTQ